MTSVPQTPTDDLPDEILSYYKNAGIRDSFCRIRNFDSKSNIHYFDDHVRSPSSRNFFVDFGNDIASCGFNLSHEDYKKLLWLPRPPQLSNRWINIWLSHEQSETLNELARHYEFSPKLLNAMCSKHCPFYIPPGEVDRSRSMLLSKSSSNRSHLGKMTQGQNLEVEDHVRKQEMSLPSEQDALMEVNHYRMVSEVWHSSFVDWSNKYVHIGYNSLHNVSPTPIANIVSPPILNGLPKGKRVWTWLLLCYDKTVISIHENPFPHNGGILSDEEHRIIPCVRRNLINVFHQLSKAHDKNETHAFTIPPIRDCSADVPGLLFYCLFDDWLESYNLVARRDHLYAAELDRLREDMLVKPELGQIERLHHLGRQLAVLKRIYQSYELIIDQILEKSAHSVSLHAPGAQAQMGVFLGLAARDKFEKLRSQIRLYALTEIQDCLDQKDALLMMNFNLIAIKESFSLERLTRITLFLAKVTVLFMPVSLMTAYFSTQLEGIVFTLSAYWISFALIFGITILFIFGFKNDRINEHLFTPLSARLMELIFAKR